MYDIWSLTAANFEDSLFRYLGTDESIDNLLFDYPVASILHTLHFTAFPLLCHFAIQIFRPARNAESMLATHA
jgi:hypothetical protein